MTCSSASPPLHDKRDATFLCDGHSIDDDHLDAFSYRPACVICCRRKQHAE
uniref:hypothetical protein n=1 Tax=Burkholderia sp. AU33423 TaxID=2015355 RepID=UPI0015C63015|nr:hypothetical protein [Burkholderia sp. AU33423]